MVTVLIVLGVVVFLAVDAYIVYRVFTGRKAADDYGAISVPGETTLSLPAGKVKVSYQEAYKASGDAEGGIDFGVPSQLEVTVTSPGGEAMEIKGPGFRGMGSVIDTGSNWSRAVVGTVELPQPGAYTVSALGELQDAVQPQILVGK